MEEAGAEAGAEGVVEEGEEAEEVEDVAVAAVATIGPNIYLTIIPCAGGWGPTPPEAEAEAETVAAEQAEEAILLPTAI